MLLHDVKNEDGIRQFFLDVWEAYVKVSVSSYASDNFQSIGCSLTPDRTQPVSHAYDADTESLFRAEDQVFGETQLVDNAWDHPISRALRPSPLRWRLEARRAGQRGGEYHHGDTAHDLTTLYTCTLDQGYHAFSRLPQYGLRGG